MLIDLALLKSKAPHFPVLINEILEYLLVFETTKDKIFVDCTFGAGGYSELILQNSQAKVIAFDRDTVVLEHAKRIGDIYGDRFIFVQDKFSNFAEHLDKMNISAVDGVVMDLGFSTMQISGYSRGFSFKDDKSLSMEMGLNNLSAFDIVNSGSQELLADIFYHYGEEYKARYVSSAIVAYRKTKSIETALELANIIRKTLGYKKGKSLKEQIDPATKSFQALRIYVNDELNELNQALQSCLSHLRPNGRLLVVSFHSLEDRIVKNFLNEHGLYHRDKFTKFKLNDPKIDSSVLFNIITKKPVVPRLQEVQINPPSASAKLRVGQRI